MSNKHTAFVAYPGGDLKLTQLITDAVSRSNAKPIAVFYRTWEFNDIPGHPLFSPILDGINESLFVVADISYLNLNVVYEIGFAIARRKRAFLVRHSATDGDKELAKEAGIFDTLGYYSYPDRQDLESRLSSHIEPTPLQIDHTLNANAPVYIVEPTTRGDAETTLVSRIKKARYRFRSFNPNEDTRLSAIDAIRQVGTSSGVVVSIQQQTLQGSASNNVRAMFVAGLSRGLDKPTLILAPALARVPLDVRDDVKTYRNAGDIAEHINQLSLDITEYQQQINPVPIKLGTQLQLLRIGEPTAENEMTTLGLYYLPTDQYNRALKGDVNLVVGRKGAGKTALFIQVRDNMRPDKRNIVVDLKPEGYQLLKLKEDILVFLSDGSRQHLITAFWEYLLLLEVAYKLLEKDQHTYKHNHHITDLYRDLQESYRIRDFTIEGDFSERLLALSRRIVSEYQSKYGTTHLQKLTGDQVTALLHVHDLRELRGRISRYLEHKDTVWVLFDNLDKGWSTQGVDTTDAIVLRCLIDASRKVEREMRKEGHKFHCIVFVRNDVYEHLMQNSADYGKEMRAVLDWTEPELLREMLRLRLVAGVKKAASSTPLDQLIRLISISHYDGCEIVDYMIGLSLMRPRNLVKLFNHARGFASNFNHEKIDVGDITKGVAAYSEDLLLELDREISDVFPAGRNVLYQLLDANSEMLRSELLQLIREAKVAEDEIEKVFDFLIYYGVVGLKTVEGEMYIYHVNYDSRKLKIRIDRAGANAKVCINAAFGPALNIKRSAG